MITKDYRPSMKPIMRDGKRYKIINGVLVETERNPPTIEVSREYFDGLQYPEPFSLIEKDHLQNNLVGCAICPALYWFNDTPQIRRLLKVKED
jgi:hypothetical protein